MAFETDKSEHAEQVQSQEPTLKKKTAKGLFWGGISSGMQQVIQLVFGVIMMKLLNPKDFGIVGMLAIFTAIAMCIQDSGFFVALINKKNIQHKDYNAVFWFNIFSSVIIYVCLFFAAPIIADFFKLPALVPVSRVLFLNFLFCGIGIAQGAYIFRNLMVKEKAKIEVLALFFSGTIGIVLAYSGLAYWAIVAQNILYFAATISIRWFYSPWKPTFDINFQPLREMFSFSIKLFFTSIFIRITENIFSVLLGRYYKEEMVGYYVQGNKWSVMGGSFISGMIGNVAMPILTQINDNTERQKNAFRKMLRFGAFVSFPLLLGLAFVGKEVLLIIGNGDKWQPAVPFLQLFCIWNSVLYIYTLYTNLLLTHHKSNIYMYGTFLTGLLQLCVIIIMFKFGIFQMVIVYIIINFAGLAFWHYFTNKIIGLRIIEVIKDVCPFLITTILSILVAFFATKHIENVYFRVFLKLLITSVLYILVMGKSNSVIVRECYNFLINKKEVAKQSK